MTEATEPDLNEALNTIDAEEPEEDKTPTGPPVVVLLHGLGRSARAMDHMAHALRGAGFDTWAYHYPSTTRSLEQIVERFKRALAEDLTGRELYAVTHSLGGIIFRHLDGLPWKRAVLVAPPNRGSGLAAALVDNPLFQFAFGSVGGALAGATKAERPWPYPPAPFGVIAGTRRFSLLNPSSWISHRVFDSATANDGTVAVDETKLDGMADFATVDATHTTIMDYPAVHALVIRFLQTGTFTA